MAIDEQLRLALDTLERSAMKLEDETRAVRNEGQGLLLEAIKSRTALLDRAFGMLRARSAPTA